MSISSYDADQHSNHVFDELAAAFVRGRKVQGDPVSLSQELAEASLKGLTAQQLQTIYAAGRETSLKLHKFKRTMGLARVERVLAQLRGIAPASLLDIGSGRGAFMWPLLDRFGELEVTAIDQNFQRANDLTAVKLGGIPRLDAYQMDVTALKFKDNSFEVVTALEVLEHIPNFTKAVSEIVRVANRFVIVSVPSKEDNNPEHIHLLTRDRLTQAFTDAGCQRLKFDSVLNHLIAIATIG